MLELCVQLRCTAPQAVICILITKVKELSLMGYSAHSYRPALTWLVMLECGIGKYMDMGPGAIILDERWVRHLMSRIEVQKCYHLPR